MSPLEGGFGIKVLFKSAISQCQTSGRVKWLVDSVLLSDMTEDRFALCLGGKFQSFSFAMNSLVASLR